MQQLGINFISFPNTFYNAAAFFLSFQDAEFEGGKSSAPKR